MSAFIVSKETMDHVVAMIDRERNKHCRIWTFGNVLVETEDQLNALGRALYDMNLDAVTQRYPGETKETAPGPCEISDLHENYRYRFRDINRGQGYKSIGCLLYQCAEGDVPKTNPLFAALDAFHNQLAHAIASDTPEYQAAVWDA